MIFALHPYQAPPLYNTKLCPPGAQETEDVLAHELFSGIKLLHTVISRPIGHPDHPRKNEPTSRQGLSF